MSQFYVVCHLGAENGRVMLGHLHQSQLQVSEVRRFPIVPVADRRSIQSNIPQLYQEILDALRTVASYEEPVHGISCTSVAGDYLLFDDDGALITPTLHHSDPQVQASLAKALAGIPWDVIYEETGTIARSDNMFLQLGAEGKRLKRASLVLPMADAFNFLLGGEPKMEISMASTTQLHKPATRSWSDRVLSALKIPAHVLPPIVTAGTRLGNLREGICKETGLDDARVVASSSEALAAALAGLPVADDECWAFIVQGDWTVLGILVPQPRINEATRKGNFIHQHAGYEGSITLQYRGNGLRILRECQRFWEQNERSMDDEMLSHLAGSATPFESLIDPADSRFFDAGDMPLKIQAFCRETNQSVPRKPGPIYRCVLESLALHYRKVILELEHATGATVKRIFVLGKDANMLLNHFTANALQRPVVVTTADSEAFGSVILQALALGHVQSIEEARAVLRASSKVQTLVPHAHLWEDAYCRFVSLVPEAAEPAAA